MAQPNKLFPIYFAPDLDPSWSVNPGVLTSVSNAVPTKRNTLITFEAPVSGDFSFSTTTYGAPRWGQILRKPDGTAFMFVGTDAYIMQYTPLVGWITVNISPVLNTTSNWAFTTYGFRFFAASKANAMMRYDTTGTVGFQVLPGAPNASCVTTQQNFVLAADTTWLNPDTSVTENFGDRVQWSGLGNDSTWAPDAATQAGEYRIVDTPGPITALVNIRDAVAAYKEDSVYLGEYQGSVLLWTWRLIATQVGSPSLHGVANVNGVHYFLHRTGIYRFDGASVQLVNKDAVRFVQALVQQQFNLLTAQAVYDEYEANIYWWLHTPDAQLTTEHRWGLVYNIITGKLGLVDQPLNLTVVSASAGDAAAWGSLFSSQKTNLLLLGTDGTVNAAIRVPKFGTDADTSAAMTLVTGDIGDLNKITTLTRIVPHAFTAIMDTNATVYGKAALSTSFDLGDAFIVDNVKKRFDGTKSARWLRASITMKNAEVSGLSLTTAATESYE